MCRASRLAVGKRINRINWIFIEYRMIYNATLKFVIFKHPSPIEIKQCQAWHECDSRCIVHSKQAMQKWIISPYSATTVNVVLYSSYCIHGQSRGQRLMIPLQHIRWLNHGQQTFHSSTTNCLLLLFNHHIWCLSALRQKTFLLSFSATLSISPSPLPPYSLLSWQLLLLQLICKCSHYVTLQSELLLLLLLTYCP